MIKEMIYVRDKNNPAEVDEYFRSEAQAMADLGIRVGVEPHPDSDVLIYRGFNMWKREEYPTDPRFIQGWDEFMALFKMSEYFPLIADLCIPTFLSNTLDDAVADEIRKRGWEKAFIKNEMKSLWNEGELASVWPDHSMDELREQYESLYGAGTYAVRKFIDPAVFYDEERYWVIMGKIYHRTGVIPDVVKEAARRLSVLGSHYFAIDVVGDKIVEVNPGEASDRLGVNSPELFASWWKDALAAE